MNRTACSLLVLTLLPNAALADSLTATRGQPVVEVSHTVRVRLDDGVAILTVQRQFANLGQIADEAALRIHLPPGAAATGLRIKARDVWYQGDLLEANEARRLYEELTGLGAWTPKDPALLQWVWADRLHLQIFPVLPQAVSTVEYTLTAATRYTRGHYVVSYPEADAASNLPSPILTAAAMPGDGVSPAWVGGRPTLVETPVVLSSAAAGPTAGIELEPGAGSVVSAISIHEAGEVTALRVDVDVDHTFRGDLELTLVPPEGEPIVLLNRQGGGENDVQAAFDATPEVPITAAGTWRLVVADVVGLDSGVLNGWTLSLTLAGRQAPIVATALDTPLFIPDAQINAFGDAGQAGLAVIELAPPAIHTVAARLGVVDVTAEESFVRLEVDAAPELSEAPRAPAVVFVVDASVSQGEEGLAAQLALVRAYLTHVPDARVELVLVRRFASRLFGAFVTVPAVEARLSTPGAVGAIRLENGSALEEGLWLAADALAGERGPKRIVAMTDDQLRSSFTVALGRAALDGLSADDVAHLVVLRGGFEISESRDDEHRLAPAISSHGGIVLQVATPRPVAAKQLAPAVLGLVRPIRIDHFTIDGMETEGREPVPSALREGEGYREMVSSSRPPATVWVRGKLWARDFVRSVSVTPAFSKRAAALVFAEDRHSGLSEAEMLRVARFGGVVSPVTSYLAVEPGVRPSTAGIEREMSGMGSMGYGAGMGGMAVRGGCLSPDIPGLLAREAQSCFDEQQPPAGWQFELSVETTGKEIVDVTVARDPLSALEACVVEAVWRTLLEVESCSSRDFFTLHFP